ncbi:phage tail tape measure protein [Salinarimonas soli]|uniref:Phage tail tape measure protein n=1 Tax=Salinarimonas soli TaxID=1638099 RepID=A0A5B2VH52_9HYPH|nr:phage tail tape measure protein [Salinarimonas soli]KAA2237669.1 phage tail tape measure protein [Salinarimonas soli]
MSQDVIKEFLVGLGFKIDESSRRRFTEGVDRATEQVKTLAVAAAATAAAVTAAVVKMAESFDQLYYASQRTGASATNIKAFGYAVSQMGGSVEGARGSLEAFGRALRVNPGNESMVKALGVQTREANGRLRDTVDILADLGGALSKKPYYIAVQYAEALGLDESTFNALVKDTRRFREEYQKTAAAVGLDNKKAAETSRELMENYRSLSLMVTTVLEKALTDIAPVLNRVLQDLRQWFFENRDKIAETLQAVAGGFERVTKALTGENGLKTAMEAFAVFAAAWALGLLRVLGPTSPLGIALAALFGLAYIANNPGPATSKPGEWNPLGDYLNGKTPKRRDETRGEADERGAAEKGNGRYNAREPEAEGTYRPKYKLSAADLDERVINTIAGEARTKNAEGVDAVINNMLNRVGSSGWGPSANLLQVARAPGQYAGYRQANASEADFIKSRIEAIASGGVPDNTNGSNSFRSSWYLGPWRWRHGHGPVIGGNRFGYVPGFDNGPYAPYQTPRKAPPPQAPPEFAPFGGKGLPSFDPGRFGGGRSPFEQSYPLMPSGGGGGDTNVEMKQETNIQVMGSSDPAATGREVAGQQRGVNAQLLRHTQGALR